MQVPGALLFFAAARAFAAGGDVVFEDAFDEDALAPAWTVSAGEWRIDDGNLTNENSGSGGLLVGEPDWDDYTLAVRMKTVRSGPRPWSVARLAFRYTDPGSHYYLVLHTTGLLELGKEQDGEHLPGLATAQDVGDPLEWHSLHVEAQGERIRISVDGQLAIDYEDAQPLLRGKVGLDAFQDAAVRFDSVRISSAGLARRQEERKAVVAETLKRLNYQASDTGNIAIFSDRDVPVRNSTPSDPVRLASILRGAGYGVTTLGARDLATAGVLTRQHFDLVMLPYGSAFPVEAIPAFTRFLKERGSFISMGGYFADNLYSTEGENEQTNLLRNPGFEEGLQHWQPSHTGVDGLAIAAGPGEAQSGDGSASIGLAEGVEPSFYSLLQQVEGADPGARLSAQAWVQTESVADGNGAYIALEYHDADGDRISWDQSGPVRGTRGWALVRANGDVPPAATRVTLKLLLHGHGQAWFDDVSVRIGTGDLTCLNTREGDIHGPGNSLRVSPEQIGLFAPDYRLEHVAALRANPDQSVIDPSFELEAPATGYSASGLFIGNGNPVRAVTHARPIHLIEAYGALGHRRGAAGVLVRNYKGVYAGSDWAAFGVDNLDLLAPSIPGSDRVLLDVVAAMLRRTFIAELHPEYACYRQGEKVELEAFLANYGANEKPVTVRFSVLARRGQERSVHERTVTATLPAGQVSSVRTTWEPAHFDDDFYVVQAELLAGGRPVDSLRNGFVVWSDPVVEAGPRIEVGNAYLKRNGRPSFLCGTGDSGYPYYAESENPLVWDDQFRLMRDMGLRYYRCMHFFSCYPTDQPFRSLDDLPQEQLRRLDALVYLAHKHGLMFLFVNNVGLQLARDDPEQLEARKAALRLLAHRYRNARGFVSNMDHQEFIRGDAPQVHAAFRAFLQRKYPAFADLAQAWGIAPDGDFGQIEFDEREARQESWDSRRALDAGEFLYSYREAWRRNAATAIHEGDPESVFSQDFSLYWWPDYPWPAPETAEQLDMTSMHYYGDPKRFPLQVKRGDMQILGKPLGMTEFGTLTHPAWQGHIDARLEPDQADAFMMRAGHYALGLGATMMSNWNWKEMKECIFPWAIAYHDLVPKAHLKAYRNMALLFGTFRPAYSPPEVFVVVPSTHLLTGKVAAVDSALRDCIARLLSCHVRFGLIGERHLDRLPSQAKALFYPLPYCPPDDTVERLTAFVESGGSLYFSGDISFDPDRKRTRTERLERLAGVRYQHENYSHLETPPEKRGSPAIVVELAGARVLADSPAGPRIVHYRLGQGNVVYALDPVEHYRGDAGVPPGAFEQALEAAGRQAATDGRPSDAYELVLRLADVGRILIDPPEPGVHGFAVQTESGGNVYLLCNAGDESREVTIRHGRRAVQVTVRGQRTALVHFNEGGELLAVESQDRAELDGAPLWHGDGHFVVASLDGAPLGAGCRRLLVMAIGEGEARLPVAEQLRSPLVEYGEFRDGEWQPLKASAAPIGDVRVSMRAALRSGIAIVDDRQGGRAADEAVEALLQE